MKDENMEKQEKKLTVLICVHSIDELHDNLLLRALKSLETQTFKQFKTILVLDECWVETEEKIKYNNFNLEIEIIKKQKKEHLSEAKNLGLSFVDTELVAFLDADDYYLDNKLEKQITFFENNDVDFLGTQYWIRSGVDESSDLWEFYFYLGQNETHGQISEIIPYQNVLGHGTMMIKMDCLRKLNFYNTENGDNGLSVIGMEDWDLWKRAINYGYKFYQIQERLYVYRICCAVPR